MEPLNTLTAANGSLAFRVGPQQWCEVYLLGAGSRCLLGADALPILWDRLRTFLAGRASLPEWRPGEAPPWKWILSLSEPHHSIYACKIGSRYAIMIEDDGARPIGELLLDEQDAATWEAQLRDWARPAKG